MSAGAKPAANLPNMPNGCRIAAGLSVAAMTGLILRFSLCVALKRPHNRMDLDNRLKPILDVLQHYQVIKNDNLCERITMTWDADIKSDCVVLVQRAEEALAA